MPSPLFFRELGSGPPLLLIHGLMVSGVMYEPLLPALDKTYRIILPDLRGHGRSGALPGPYGVTQLARDLAELLDDLQVESAFVVGYSQGGAVAQQLAHDYPARVSALVLGCTFAYNMLTPRERMEGTLAPWLVRLLGTRRLAGLVMNAGGGPPLEPATRKWLVEMIGSNDSGKMVEAVEAMKAFDSRPWLGEIQCPTLVIAGAEDSGVPVAHAEMLAQGIPHAQLHVVPGAGHSLIWTHTALFVQLVQDFFRSVRD